MPVFGPLPLTPGLPSPSSRPMAGPALTGSARQCARPRSLPATCPPRPAGAGRPSWSQVCPGTRTSAGTGSAAPAGGPPAAGARAASQGDVSASIIRPLVTSRRSLQATQAAPPGSHPGLPDHSLERCSAPGRHGPPSLHPQCPTRTPPP